MLTQIRGEDQGAGTGIGFGAMGIKVLDTKGRSAVRESKAWATDPKLVSEIHRAQARQGPDRDFEPFQFCFKEAAVEARIVRNDSPSGQSLQNLAENLFEGRSITEIATTDAVYFGWPKIPIDPEEA